MPMNIPTLVELKYAHDDGTSVALCKRLAACIEDGAAILSREDREQAMEELSDGLNAGECGLASAAELHIAEARRLLQLEKP